MDLLKRVAILIIAIIGFYAIAGMVGLVDLEFYHYFGVKQANIERDIFKENKSYVDGMASDLAKYKYELATEKDATARKAIVDLINDKYANFNIDELEDTNLQQFLRNVRNGNYNELEEQ